VNSASWNHDPTPCIFVFYETLRGIQVHIPGLEIAARVAGSGHYPVPSGPCLMILIADFESHAKPDNHVSKPHKCPTCTSGPNLFTSYMRECMVPGQCVSQERMCGTPSLAEPHVYGGSSIRGSWAENRITHISIPASERFQHGTRIDDCHIRG